jgi:hypothetical protein
MNPRAVLQERYPQTDFWEYFRFLGECKGTTLSGRTNDHHICPEKQFPEYKHDPENLITLTIEDHAYAHELLGAAVPELRATPAFIRKQNISHSSEVKAQISAANTSSWKDPQVRARRSAGSKAAVNRPDIKEKRREATRAGVIAWHARRRAELCHV